MERKRGERARCHDEEMLLVLDERIGAAEQSRIKLLRKVEVKKSRLAHLDRFIQLIDIETMAKGGNLDNACLPSEIICQSKLSRVKAKT